jgi:uncharacterized protein YcaQ
MKSLDISKGTARRFIMGKQGLWPGRRYAGLGGTDDALRQMNALQLDPLNVVARSQDIAMFGRVLDYRPAHLRQAVYEQRGFFDYGAALFLYPMSELPYWRLHMKRRSEQERWVDFASEHPEAMVQVLEALRDNGPMGNRDFKGNKAFRDNYRGRKDTSVALYAHWMAGRVMIHHRDGFERVYDLSQRVAPPQFNYAAPEVEAEDFFARKTVSFLGLMRDAQWRTGFEYYIQRKLDAEETKAWLDKLYEGRVIETFQIEGSKERWIVLREDLPDLEKLASGKIPASWTPLGPDTKDEVTFLAPLEIVSARGRAKQIFDFEYIWEVYKPVSQRRWGYYVLPILYEDDLVARFDPRLDRETMTLHIKGFWPEADALVSDPSFANALGKGLARFASFVGALGVNMDAIQPRKLRNHLLAFVKPADLDKEK